MSMPSEHMDERTFYPYYLLFGYEKYPFKSDFEKQEANKLIEDFIDIVETEKQKSPEFSKKIDDIDFKVLLSEPKGEWHTKYTFKDDQQELINEAVQGKSAVHK